VAYREIVRDERGFVSALGLCVLMVILLLALGTAHFMRSASSTAAEYERELQLRLAAESGIETAAAALEHTASAYGALPPYEARKRIDVESVPAAEGIEVLVFLERPPEGAGEGYIYLAAAAVDQGGTRIPDGEEWQRAKIVRALMEKKDERYVWRRWF